jgi:hypothetical protein
MNAVKLIFPCVLLYLLFISPTMELDEAFKPDLTTHPVPLYSTTTGGPSGLSAEAKLLLAEHRKCVEEIQHYADQESRWFELKFMFAGAFILGFFLQALLKPSLDSDAQPNSKLSKIVRLPTMQLVIALACVVSIVVDTHIRANRNVVNQNGIWIAEFVEPVFLRTDAQVDYQKQVLAWEQFLRVKAPGNEQAHHTDLFYSLTFWPYMYLITIGLYALYLFILYETRTIADEEDNSPTAYSMRRFAFWLLHLTLLVCVSCTHYVPSMYRISIFGSPLIASATVFMVYPLMCVVLIAWSRFFLYPHSNESRKGA